MYKPNFNDPRIQKRIKRAIGFACGFLSENKSRQISTRYIDKYFGGSSRPLSKYLRSILLLTTNERWSQDEHKCKEYRLNLDGIDYLRKCLINNSYTIPYCNGSFETQAVTDLVQEEFHTELETKVFEYKDKSNRLWHPIQNIRKEYKHQILASNGLTHQYDIECCAPTLLLQYAQQQGMEQWPVAFGDYIENRTGYRLVLAQELDITEHTAKQIFNALLCGARLGVNDQFDLSNLLDNDYKKVFYLRTSKYITDLRRDIKMIWDHINPTLTQIYITDKNTKQRRKALSSNRKWAVYFDLERCVLNSVRVYLNQTNNKHLAEHDGWTCENPIDQQQLIDHVRTTTRFKIRLSYESLNY